jgi:ketol-acid reductoisomerase
MANIIEETDIDASPLLGKRIAVVGYGSQGRAQALNLRDGGYDVRVALPAGSTSANRAAEDGFSVQTVREASADADVIVLAAPDVRMPAVFEGLSLRAGQTLVFLHGFAYHFGFVSPPEDVDVVLVSPAGPGPVLRRLFQEGSGFGSLYAVGSDATGGAKRTALAYAKAVGCAKAGVIETTFKEETETDLFGEQAILCGGLPELIKAGFDTLVNAGYQPEIAFFECMHQVKLITDLIYEGGLTYMRNSISGTAEWGGFESGPRIIGEEARNAMKAVLNDIQSGKFAEGWMKEHEAGESNLAEQRQNERTLPIEGVGREMRKRMPFIDDK